MNEAEVAATMKWTNEQLQGITHSGENILLAAAAGSGKTAVLSERVLQKILTENVNIENLLVLTFTDKTAVEMRAKIGAKLNQALIANPDNAHLRRQTLHINRANISTIHSFCLEVIKNNIHLTSLPANFSVGGQNECDIIKTHALTETLNKAFTAMRKRSDIAELFDGYGNGRDDKDIRKLILDLHGFSRNLPAPNKWLIKSWLSYKQTEKTGKLDENLVKQFREMILFYISRNDELLTEFNHLPTKTYSEIIEAVNLLKTMKSTVNPRKKLLPKTGNEELYKLTNFDAENYVEHVAKSTPAIGALVKLVIAFERRYKRKKLERKLLDFDDFQHEMLKLLMCKGKQTLLAEQLSVRYCEILIDEYQDINALQNEIFTAISRGNRNIFMVGDIKQSIYQFRGADPSLFLERYKAYSINNDNDLTAKHPSGVPSVTRFAKEGIKSEGRLIKLYKNFRSRDTVIDFANFIFRMAMSETVGDVDYNEDEELIQGSDYPTAGEDNNLKTEIYLLRELKEEALLANELSAKLTKDCKPSLEKRVAGGTPDGCFDNPPPSLQERELLPEAEDLSKIEREAIFAAKRIREIIDNGEILITDKTSGNLRAATYRDFAILSPTVNGGIAKTIEKRLFDANIPAYGDVGESYLTAWEVMTVLSFLQVIDNPLQDIPLIAVLRSVMFNFSPEELAEIRICERRKNMPFYMALEISAENGNEKCAEFIRGLDKLRGLSVELGVDQLIWHIYEEFGFYEYVGSLKGGAIMQANLRLLFERAGEFEQSRLKGLFNFNHYIITLIQEGQDFSPAKVVSESENVVRIMSIHKSKGLEFPIVIMLNSGKLFYTNDITHSKVLWHTNVGIGAYYIDSKRRAQYPSVTRDVVAFTKQRNMISEEMRKLYVAVTRAKEKLIIIGTPDRHFDGRQKKVQFTLDEKLSPFYAAEAKSYLDWIVPSVKMTDCEFADLVEVNVNDAAEFELTTLLAKELSAKITEDCNNLSLFGDGDSFTERDFKADEQFIYAYAHLNKIPMKLSVSEIKRQQMPEDDVAVPYFRYSSPNLSYAAEELSGAERGTIAHFVMQHLDERSIETFDDVRTQIDKMVQSEKLTVEQAKTIDVAAVFRFFQSELGTRLRNAKTIEKEVKFYMKILAAEILPELSQVAHNGEEILVQGVVDCYFIEETDDLERLVIIDYKTDRVSEQTVGARANEYKTALEYYARGLGEILEMPVDEKYLYFFENNMLVMI